MLTKDSEEQGYTSLAVLACAAFLAPVIGGHLSIGTLPISVQANPLVLALRGLPQASALSHAFVTGMCAFALVDALVESPTLIIPNVALRRLLFGLLSIIAISVCVSSFLPASSQTALDWMAFGIAFFAVLNTARNAKGARVILCGLFCGCVTVSGLGILEYLSMLHTDPSWRIFSVWEGPNALAGMLLIGFFIGLGLMLVSGRLWAIMAGVGSVSIGIGIVLTQSKGGIIAFAAGVLLFLGLAALKRSKALLFRYARTGLCTVGLVVVLSLAVSAYAHTATSRNSTSSIGHSPFSRILKASDESDQSVEFRMLLWKSGVELIRRHPLGTGVGTFQYFSAQPGLVTGTYTAHQTFVELAEEASPLAAVVLVCLIVVWVSSVLGGKFNGTEAGDPLALAVVVAVIALMLHGFVDSDLSYFGIGVAIFILLAAGLLLKGEASQAVSVSKTVRAIWTILVVSLSGAPIYLGLAAAWRGEALFAANRRLPEAESRLALLKSWDRWDPEVWNIASQMSQDPSESLEFARKSAELCPDTEYLDALATKQAESRLFSEAIATLRRALILDPNNLPTLLQLSRMQLRAGLSRDYYETLRDIVGIEATTAFRIRSLPNMIPTETYIARVRLANSEPDPKVKIRLLEPAVKGYEQYILKALPRVLQLVRRNGPLAQSSNEESRERLGEAFSAARDLAAAYIAVGNAKGATEMLAEEKSVRTAQTQLDQSALPQ